MAQQTQNFRGRKFSGDLMGRTHGAANGFLKLGNVTELTTSQEVETDELKSTGREDYGQAIEVETTPQPIKINIKFNTFDRDALARMLMGEAVDVGGSSTTIDETPIKAKLKGWMKLGVLDIDPENFELKNSLKTTIDKAHYELNPRTGMLKLNAGAGVDDGATLYFSGKTKGREGFAIDANTLQSIHLELYLDGKDRISGNDGVLEIAHVVLSADGNINWFEEGWLESGLSGTIVKDEGKPAMRFTEFVG